ncbi:MAG: UvrD-helicase domain-containing protein [Deltaproteobacteria bacterium]|nr:UvrD-helicase domain-containing protein [Deltaproteobacteria bacterium]
MKDSFAPTDAAERARALETDRSFVVQAPAGSGKTELLAQRFLALLATVEHPEELLAITFTRKAAAEMRGRISKALRRGGDPTPPEAAHERRSYDLARAVLARDAAAGWSLLSHPSRLRILTLDALCRALTQRTPLLSRLGAEPDLTQNAAPLYREAAARTLARLEQEDELSLAAEPLLLHVDNDLLRLEGLLADILARRDQWLRHLAQLGAATDATRASGRVLAGDPLRAELEAALAHEVEASLGLVLACAPRQLLEQAVPLAREAAAQLAAENPGHPLCACAGLTAVPEPTPAGLPAWRGLAALFLILDGSRRKQVDKRVGFPAASSTKDPEEKARREDRKARAVALLAALEDEEPFLTRLAAVRTLPPSTYTDEQWAVLRVLLGVLPRAAAELTELFRERGQVDFIELGLAARRALGDPDHPTDLALALDYRLRHVLVDEFQDTSWSQYHLLEQLVAGWEPGDGRTLFLVGDPMQSIYRFREAEVGLFLRAQRTGVESVALESLRLEQNFRCSAGIVGWVNDTFPGVLAAEDDPQAGAVSYSASLARPATSLVSPVVHPFLEDDPAREAALVVRLVRESLERPSGGDGTPRTVAILVRARTHLAEIVPALKAAQLRFQAVEIDQLGERPVVQDLYALTRALLHPADRVAWLALLRGPTCGLSLGDLHALVAGATGVPVCTLLADPERRAALTDDGRRRLSRLWEVLEPRVADARRGSLRRWVEGTWIALGGPACLGGDEALGGPAPLEDAEAYLGLLAEHEVGGDLPDLDPLEEGMRRLYAGPDAAASPALQVMTIHKAKGLEFDTVIVPGLGRTPRSESPQLLRWLERPGRRAPGELLLAPVRAADQAEEAIYRYLAAVERERGEREAGRLLYVATTRAKASLHLLGHVGATVDKAGERALGRPANGSLLALLWHAVEPRFAAALDEQGLLDARASGAALVQPAAPERPPLVRLPATWTLPPLPEAAPVPGASAVGGASQRKLVERRFDWAGERARRVGTVVHRYLRLVGRDGRAAWSAGRVQELRPSFRAALLQEGLSPEACAEAAVRVEAALTLTLEDERGSWVLDGAHAEAENELELVAVAEGKLERAIIDRTFVDRDGVRWIVDYKTSEHRGGDREAFLDNEQALYRPQLERYAELLRLVEARPIRLGLYFPLLGGWREWAFGGRDGERSAG